MVTEWNRLTRLSQDICAQTLEERQSQLPGLYMVQEPGFRWCETARNYSHLMSEPAHQQKQYRNACKVDNDSELRYSMLTNKRYIHQLFTRPYLGSFEGAGQSSLSNKDVESQLFYGLDTRGGPRKACDVLAGVSIDRFECLPEYGNPQRVQHVVEPWVRGGDHTRDYVRRVNYEKQCLNRKNNQLINGVTKSAAPPKAYNDFPLNTKAHKKHKSKKYNTQLIT